MKKVICFNDPIGETDFLSNWYVSDFTVAGYSYFAMEQYIAHQKALTFGDLEIAQKVMQSFDFEEMKALGRQVRNYDNTVWNGIRQIVVYEGLLAKFGQNPELKQKLLATGDALLAEAEEYDSIWGIGLSMEDERNQHPDAWKGQNLLGFALIQVRQKLAQE